MSFAPLAGCARDTSRPTRTLPNTCGLLHKIAVPGPHACNDALVCAFPFRSNVPKCASYFAFYLSGDDGGLRSALSNSSLRVIFLIIKILAPGTNQPNTARLRRFFYGTIWARFTMPRAALRSGVVHHMDLHDTFDLRTALRRSVVHHIVS